MFTDRHFIIVEESAVVFSHLVLYRCENTMGTLLRLAVSGRGVPQGQFGQRSNTDQKTEVPQEIGSFI